MIKKNNKVKGKIIKNWLFEIFGILFEVYNRNKYFLTSIHVYVLSNWFTLSIQSRYIYDINEISKRFVHMLHIGLTTKWFRI